MDASVILLSVPCPERVPPLTLGLTDDQMAQATLGRVVVRWHVRFGHEDEEFPYPIRGRLSMKHSMRRHSLSGSARKGRQMAKQLPLPGQLGNTPSANSPHQI